MATRSLWMYLIERRDSRSEFVKKCTSCAFLAIAKSGTGPDVLPRIKPVRA